MKTRREEKFNSDPMNRMTVRSPVVWTAMVFLATLGSMTVVVDILERPVDKAFRYGCALAATLTTLFLTRSRLKSAEKRKEETTNT